MAKALQIKYRSGGRVLGLKYFFVSAIVLFAFLNHGEARCRSRLPGLTISPTQASVVTGQSASFNVTIKNNDSDCKPTTFTLSTTQSSSVSVSQSASQLRLSPGQSTQTLLTAVASTAGFHTVSVRLSDNDGLKPSHALVTSALTLDVSAPTPAPEPSFALSITSPESGATVSGVIQIRGSYSGYLNIEAYDLAGTMLGRAILNSGTFSIPVDTTKLVNGSQSLSIRAWDSLPGISFTRTESKSLSLNVQNTVASPTQPTGPTPSIANVTISLAPRAGETSVLQMTGTFPAGTTFDWTATQGSIAGSGTKVNYVSDSDYVGPVVITAYATANGATVSRELQISVSPGKPRMVIESVLNLGGGNFTFSGRALNLSNPASFKIGGYQHNVFFQKVAGSPFFISSSGAFSFTTNMNPDTQRITFMLVSSTVNLDDGAHCLNGACGGVFDTFTPSGKIIPFALNTTDVFDFQTQYFLSPANHVDPQIRNLLSRFSKSQVPGLASPAYLVRSFLDTEQMYVYDQALAALAFISAGERLAAEKILNALKNLQLPGGGWYLSYNHDGSSPYPNEGDRQFSGNIAWVVMAANAYHLRFSSTAYDGMAKAALDALALRRFTITQNGVTSNPIAFNGTDLPSTPWSELSVASMEHNIDAYSAFYHYGRYSGQAYYSNIAADLKRYLTSSWNGTNFYGGYETTGPNSGAHYLDAQTWNVLALGVTGPSGENYIKGLELNCQHLYEPAGYLNFKFAGVAGFFDGRLVWETPTNRFVWSEGTLGHSLAMRRAQEATGQTLTCDGKTHADFVEEMKKMDDHGIAYASQSKDSNFTNSSSIAGTAWLYFNIANFNPFQP